MRYFSVLPYRFIAVVILSAGLCISIFAGLVAHARTNDRLISVHDRGVNRSFISDKQTLREAFKQQDIVIDPNDIVEPGLDEPLTTNNYQVNIYRARPIMVVDGVSKVRVMSAYQTASQIAKHAGISLVDEDETELQVTDNVMADGASLRMTIDRATPVNLVLYGKPDKVYTQATTVAEFLKEKSIKLADDDTISLKESDLITPYMELKVYRNGVQTITIDEVIEPPIEIVRDANRPVGFKEVTEEGKPGKKSVTYEITMQNGIELERKMIQSVDIEQPVKRVETIGVKSNGNGLTKGKGVNMFVDSNGVTHRETYYDLPMSTVMRNCGAGGHYTVREDGAKIDASGYVIIAANLSRYPRCTVVETSLGQGKVYDTGGFAAKHPDGWDLATDWTNNDGV